MGLNKAKKIKVLAGLCFFFFSWKLQGGSIFLLFQVTGRIYRRCLQFQTELHCQLLQATHIPWRVAPSFIFRASNGGQILLMLQIPLFLTSLTQLGKQFLLLKTCVITLGPPRYFRQPPHLKVHTPRTYSFSRGLGCQHLWGVAGGYCAYHITISLSSVIFPFFQVPGLLNQGKYLVHKKFKPYPRLDIWGSGKV